MIDIILIIVAFVVSIIQEFRHRVNHGTSKFSYQKIRLNIIEARIEDIENSLRIKTK